LAIPDDPTEPIALTSESTDSLAITIPNARSSEDAEVVVDDAMAYAQGDGSQTVVAPHADGSTQFLSVIAGAEAPTEFAYGISTQGSLRLEVQPDGSVAGFDAEGVGVIAVAAPWAVDADGTPVPTRYGVSGDKLVQIVDHRSPACSTR